ncbi:mechanosensitive ion channel protein MscS [Kiloniella spongiae]|uniref:Small-conductance mechanosensitive channel n=1 Tax=Kiloniella spongiae TaxID=1489064 RepID=A0A0H2MJ10_9PROT|nr:mechanosensitive ion channel family protein [Kiloniella spongiae]KLN62519.1 mechanosensitive ion channel protein MscS [Kiloniella spongiae]
MDEELKTAEALINKGIEFGVAYGFQILGAIIVLIIGLKIAGWIGGKVTGLCLRKEFDQTLSGFIGNIVKVVLVAFVIIITLGNFGISTAPLIALAGAGAFGATLAIQGPLSNYGAGLSIILTRPFTIGDTIIVKGGSGVVHEVKLAYTQLIGEDKELITIPNKRIVGEVITNSHRNRIVETRIPLAGSVDADRAIEVLRNVLEKDDLVPSEPRAQIGVHDFTYGGVVIGLRYWVPSQCYYQERYRVNTALLSALKTEKIELLSGGTAIAVSDTTADFEEMY